MSVSGQNRVQSVTWLGCSEVGAGVRVGENIFTYAV